MRLRRLFVMVTALAMLMVMVSPAVAEKGTNGKVTVDQLTNAGWFCFEPDPGEPHCLNGEKFAKIGTPAAPPTLNVMVFDGADFAGTEILWRNDIYNGQPCPQAALIFLPFGYTGCHHFNFGG